MDKAKIAANKPVVFDCEPGTYYWCTCGLSAGQPMCDGSHKPTDLKPMQFTIDEKRRIALCTCKATKTPPYCDGSHKNLYQ